MQESSHNIAIFLQESFQAVCKKCMNFLKAAYAGASSPPASAHATAPGAASDPV